jgi:hypothetical protein
MNKHTHRAVIETLYFFWVKRYRYACKTCGEKGEWRRSLLMANADGWYHDDVTLFELLTRPPSDKSSPR